MNWNDVRVSRTGKSMRETRLLPQFGNQFQVKLEVRKIISFIFKHVWIWKES